MAFTIGSNFTFEPTTGVSFGTSWSRRSPGFRLTLRGVFTVGVFKTCCFVRGYGWARSTPTLESWCRWRTAQAFSWASPVSLPLLSIPICLSVCRPGCLSLPLSFVPLLRCGSSQVLSLYIYRSGCLKQVSKTARR